jgi:hypothetical protein
MNEKNEIEKYLRNETKENPTTAAFRKLVSFEAVGIQQVCRKNERKREIV